MPTPTSAVKVNPLTGALIDPPVATFAAANGLLTGGSSDAKDSVRVATTANGTLATAFANGQTVDGIALVTGNRILLKNQSAPAENGIYTVNASGAPTRATDFDAWTEIVGAFTNVEAGTVNAGTQWLCNVVSGGTIGTTAITFVVPKNFVDLTTNQTVGGNKYFGPNGTFGGVQLSKDGINSAFNAQLQFLEDDSVVIISASSGYLWMHTVGDTDVTLPETGTLLSTDDSVTGSGDLVRATSPSLSTPSISGATITTASPTTSALAASAALSGDLFPHFWMNQQFADYPWGMDGGAVTAGTGSVSGSYGNLTLSTGATANSSAVEYGNPAYGATQVSGGDSRRINWAKTVFCSTSIAFVSAQTTNGIVRFLVGSTNGNPATLDARGVGIVITYNAANVGNVALIAHNGTTLTTSATLGTINTSAFINHRFTIVSAVGSVYLFVDNAYMGSTTGGPSSSSGSGFYSKIMILNGVDATSQSISTGTYRIYVKP